MRRLFLCGDVMTGRGIDQVLPHPCPPRLYEGYARSAQEYVALAEAAHGSIGARRGFEYVWGDALEALARARPDVRIANLETAVTTSDDPWPEKGIHYRMHPRNVPCLAAAGLDCCVLANNHVLDWGRDGLAQTLDALHGAGIRTAGAGRDADEALAPAAFPLAGGGRVLVFALATASSGVPREWAAAAQRSGVSFLPEPSASAVAPIARRVRAHRRAGDLVVVSIHWGGNWGYGVADAERRFAHALVDEAGADVVHGHSSHHAKAFEVHAGRLVLYGCGDFVNDYEGIGGGEAYRPELAPMYLPLLRDDGRLERLDVVVLRRRRFRLERAGREGREWWASAIGGEAERLGTARSWLHVLVDDRQPGGGAAAHDGLDHLARGGPP